MIGDVLSREAWTALEGDADAALVDVRTAAEWSYVGLPDLDPVGKRVVLAAWQEVPSGALNEGFLDDLAAAGLRPEQPIFFICRSGSRSLAAAHRARDAGYTRCSNVRDGFEGPRDAAGHRGTVAGWKAAGLPWQQG